MKPLPAASLFWNAFLNLKKTDFLFTMRIVMGCDHAGFSLKQLVQKRVRAWGFPVVDVGARRLLSGDDYPDYAEALAEAIQKGRARRGILICGSGVGACIAVNKFNGIRAALCENTFSAHQGVEDDDANVLCLGARVTGPELAFDIVQAFLRARFSGAARHRRRVRKIESFERCRRP
jgi:ribose 5-phosphate isomerase B